jgi:hypothetical protein
MIEKLFMVNILMDVKVPTAMIAGDYDFLRG